MSQRPDAGSRFQIRPPHGGNLGAKTGPERRYGERERRQTLPRNRKYP
jgi:hypothetical protein